MHSSAPLVVSRQASGDGHPPLPAAQDVGPWQVWKQAPETHI
jgi:hypothetical protein